MILSELLGGHVHPSFLLMRSLKMCKMKKVGTVLAAGVPCLCLRADCFESIPKEIVHANPLKKTNDDIPVHRFEVFCGGGGGY